MPKIMIQNENSIKSTEKKSPDFNYQALYNKEISA